MSTTLSCLLHKFPLICVTSIKELANYTSVLELAFDRDVNIAFDGSVALADYVGVSTEKVLRNKQEIDQYFLN